MVERSNDKPKKPLGTASPEHYAPSRNRPSQLDAESAMLRACPLQIHGRHRASDGASPR
jgi:hypothetical protein